MRKTQELLDKTEAAAKGIDQLLDDVLLLGRVESGQAGFCLVPLDLAKFCNELVGEFQSSLKLKPPSDPVTLIFVNHSQSAMVSLEVSLLGAFWAICCQMLLSILPQIPK